MRAGWLAVVAAASACGAPVTEVLVSVDTDLTAPAEIDQVRFVVTDPAARAEPEVRPFSVVGRDSFPVTLAVVHQGGALAGYAVEVTGGKAAMAVTPTERRELTFVKGELTMVRIRLLRIAGVGVEPPGSMMTTTAPCAATCGGCARTDCATGGAGACSCKEGCGCTFACAGSKECEVRCEEGSTCTATAAPAGTVKLFSCEKASCTFDARGAANVTVECGKNSTCAVDCRETSRCGMKCGDKASCLVRCSAGKDCAIDDCDGKVVACGGDVFACGGAACP